MVARYYTFDTYDLPTMTQTGGLDLVDLGHGLALASVCSISFAMFPKIGFVIAAAGALRLPLHRQAFHAGLLN